MSLVALGVTGGIGAYKAIEVCRGLQKRGHDVVAVMTRSAARFVGPVTFEAITRRPVITSQWKPGMNSDIEHIAIADQIALLLVAPAEIAAAADAVLAPPDSALRGRRIVVTAGPTYEDIDPVRYVGNRSSGRMGFAIAAAAHARGANVTLICGPTAIEPPAADEVIKVRRAVEMHAAVMRVAEHADVVIMA